MASIGTLDLGGVAVNAWSITTVLSLLVALLAAIAAASGLFFTEDGEPFAFTTLRGQTARIYGRGLYRYDTLFTAAARACPGKGRLSWGWRCRPWWSRPPEAWPGAHVEVG